MRLWHAWGIHDPIMPMLEPIKDTPHSMKKLVKSFDLPRPAHRIAREQYYGYGVLLHAVHMPQQRPNPKRRSLRMAACTACKRNASAALCCKRNAYAEVVGSRSP